MRDLLADYDRLAATGRPVGRAVVTSVWGSAPRPEGACLLATAEGQIAGSVSGGCVETAVAGEIAEAIARGTPRLVTYGVTDEKAWEVGLACGGTIRVFVEPAVAPAALAAARGEGGMAVATVVEGGEAVGQTALIADDGRGHNAPAVHWLADAVRDRALEALRRERGAMVEATAPGGGTVSVFLEPYPRRPTLVIVGAVHIAAALVPFARALGYRTVVADGRAAFLSRERFPEADLLLQAWPDEAFRQIGLDRATYVCVLSHDPKCDEPALEAALRSPAPYIGAIGSKKTQAARRERLRGLGYSEEDLARLHGPIGLDLGGRSPAETALAIMAEMTAVRYGVSAG